MPLAFVRADPADPALILPAKVVEQALALDHYIAENAKSARAFLKALGISRPLRSVEIAELNKHAGSSNPAASDAEMDRLLAPLKNGFDVGLVSEAGAPAVLGGLLDAHLRRTADVE